MTKEWVTYREFGDMCDYLVRRIKKDTRNITAIYGIPRGGFPLAVHLSHHLNIQLLEFPWNFKDRKSFILIVDDISDTGKTLKEKKEMFELAGFVTPITVSLFYKQNTCLIPDYFFEETAKWVVFPWETNTSEISKYHQKIYPELSKKIEHFESGSDDPDINLYLQEISSR